MVKSRKFEKGRMRRRTSLEIEEEQSRTLYIRVPHTIKNVDEINELFFGDFKVKIPRQSTRYCHVIFSGVEEKVKNLKAIKKKLIDGKPIFAGPPKPINLELKKKRKQKKIVIPEPTDPPKVQKYLFISNIAPGVKASEVKEAFPGSTTVGLLKGLINGKRQARVKMSSGQLCTHYIQNKSEWPVLHGQKVYVALSKTTNNNNNKIKKKKRRSKSKPLKMYDGENEQKDVSKLSQKSEEANKNEESKEGTETESDTEEDVENEEEDEEVEETEESSEEE